MLSLPAVVRLNVFAIARLFLTSGPTRPTEKRLRTLSNFSSRFLRKGTEGSLSWAPKTFQFLFRTFKFYFDKLFGIRVLGLAIGLHDTLVSFILLVFSLFGNTHQLPLALIGSFS